MAATVLLRHDLPDGTWHYDWLIERPDGRLTAFRVRDRIDEATTGPFHAERIADHRHEYLDFEGPVSGNRGSVRRIARGTGRVLADTPDRYEAELEYGAGTRRFRGDRTPGGSWSFSVAPAP